MKSYIIFGHFMHSSNILNTFGNLLSGFVVYHGQLYWIWIRIGNSIHQCGDSCTL